MRSSLLDDVPPSEEAETGTAPQGGGPRGRAGLRDASPKAPSGHQDVGNGRRFSSRQRDACQARVAAREFR